MTDDEVPAAWRYRAVRDFLLFRGFGVDHRRGARWGLEDVMVRIVVRGPEMVGLQVDENGDRDSHSAGLTKEHGSQCGGRATAMGIHQGPDVLPDKETSPRALFEPSSFVRLVEADSDMTVRACGTWFGLLSTEAEGDRLDVAMFPEIALDTECRIVAGTCVECRSMETSYPPGLYPPESFSSKRWTWGRFVIDLDNPQEELRSHQSQTGLMSLTISKGHRAGLCTIRDLLLTDSIQRSTKADEWSIHVLAMRVTRVACQFCSELHRSCECTEPIREKHCSPPNWQAFVKDYRVSRTGLLVSTRKLVKTDVTLRSSSLDYWPHSDMWKKQTEGYLIPAYLEQAPQGRSPDSEYHTHDLSSDPTAAQNFDHGREWNSGGRRYKGKQSTRRPRVKCPTCDQSFCRPSYLTSHIAIAHEHAANFVCQTCFKSFSSVSNLNRHRRSIHENLRNFFCCSQSFFASSDYRRHLKRVHGQ